MSGKYAPGVIFSDWVQCMAIAIQNACQTIHNKSWRKREESYAAVIRKYENDEIRNFCGMMGMLTLEMEERPRDILGEIYMESGCGSRYSGQFFTPYHLSELTARCMLSPDISSENPLEVYEPSVGGGGMIIATAVFLKEKGINYQTCMKVTAQDLDWRSVYMSYVQFSLLGINAVVAQGDTLAEPYRKGYPEDRVLYTPGKMKALI